METREALDVKLYNERIPVEKNPKILGIIFDRRLTFDKHFESIDLKLIDRLNILKILSYDKNWRLDTTTLIRIYKSLVRSVLDYACVTSVACNTNIVRNFRMMH